MKGKIKTKCDKINRNGTFYYEWIGTLWDLYQQWYYNGDNENEPFNMLLREYPQEIFMGIPKPNIAYVIKLELQPIEKNQIVIRVHCETDE